MTALPQTSAQCWFVRAQELGAPEVDLGAAVRASVGTGVGLNANSKNPQAPTGLQEIASQRIDRRTSAWASPFLGRCPLTRGLQQ